MAQTKSPAKMTDAELDDAHMAATKARADDEAKHKARQLELTAERDKRIQSAQLREMFGNDVEIKINGHKI